MEGLSAVLLDPLFRVPFVTGLLLATVLPLVGTLLMLREEWLAALGFAHLAAASALLGLAGGVPQWSAQRPAPSWAAPRRPACAPAATRPTAS
jgi:ABC-type Mn2+/Zn2+ transport system permease subunit